ncbi:H(+)/Cl(-) exchange transporter 3 [Salpingoeca rosetta]|uniref:Chloride channel protein n=1 Tax=Salpingoeca rosetta (strain ATCC 50818 / BSB-021) TaxID=946362 RepID=F2TYY9_SALR5|nr:H(+)/Cl(-) exchange transporter 3 [Salpingoeca rosetta]EGD78813.1 H(+)/Cl(-) exchange transporter 3 [Salpingoeca rosetta]|eukprot:XP_004997769.1 H(+)/Cl(-) exchange transporter 3 [Salpingoeca rosetta]
MPKKRSSKGRLEEMLDSRRRAEQGNGSRGSHYRGGREDDGTRTGFQNNGRDGNMFVMEEQPFSSSRTHDNPFTSTTAGASSRSRGSNRNSGSRPRRHSLTAQLNASIDLGTGRRTSKVSVNGADGLGPGDDDEDDDEMILLAEEPEHDPVLHRHRSFSPGILGRLGIGRDARPDFRYDDYSTIDWARDTALELKRKKESVRFQGYISQAWDAASGWVLMGAIGVLCGVFAGFIDIGAEWLSDIKEGVCPRAFWLSRKHCCWAEELAEQRDTCELWKSWGEMAGYSIEDDARLAGASFAVRYFAYMGWAALLAGICALLVVRISPYAAGSGIPEVKTILSGFIIRGYFSLWTLAVKALGMVAAVAAGLSLGKEGPLVHVACCCGNALSYLFAKYRLNEAKRREVLSGASAAGVSVAFGAPVGGVLFSLEEVSYYFPHKTMWRSFFAAMVGAVVLSNLNPFLSGHLVKFYVEFDYPWHWFELIPFIIIGVFGGLYGAFFNRFNLNWCSFRNQSALRKYGITEVVCVALVTALLSFPNRFTRSSAADTIAALFSECAPGSVDPLCDDDRSIIMGDLLLACAFKALITIFTFGIKAPAGLFIPTMFVGATFGRVIGMVVEDIVASHESVSMIANACPNPDTCITPGLYAMVGAAATLGGVTRMTVSLVVIMFELTGGLTYILPLMLAVMISKWVGDAFNRDGIYDRHIRLKGFPFLDTKEEFSFATRAVDVMQPPVSADEPPVVLPCDGLTVAGLEDIIRNHTFTGFPIVNNRRDMLPRGYLIRSDALDALAEYKHDPDCDMSAPVQFFEDDAEETSFSRAVGDAMPSEQALDVTAAVHRDVFQVSHTMVMPTVIELFRRMGIRQAIVMREGRLVGILTKKDVIKHMHVMTARHANVQYH